MRIKLNESKKLEFNMDTIGCSWEDLKGHLRFTFENIEYGFPADFKDGKLVVEVPPFQSVISQSLNESISKNKEVVVKGRLDVVANENNYVMPWSGDVEIEVPVAIRVKNNKDIQDIIEAAKDIKVNTEVSPIATISTAKENPEPFDKILKKAKSEAEKKTRDRSRSQKRSETSKFAKMMMGDK